ncbi:hypothetical protein, partial [Paraburkholderia sp. RL17-373-BIF-A]|uniref:hypothetical protein n=1 Tax=Paraburkholderia sp. RL17-373-BIF-A TaxID=3031629 RepID=UPI0038B97666
STRLHERPGERVAGSAAQIGKQQSSEGDSNHRLLRRSSSDGKIGQTVVDQTRRNQRTIAVRPTDWDSISGFHQGQAGMRLTLKSGCMAAIYAFKCISLDRT